MHKFMVHFISGRLQEVHFDVGKDAVWVDTLRSLKNGQLETLKCEKEGDYIRINWDNVETIIPIGNTLKTFPRNLPRKGKK